ncbi:MAG: hypothetical protein ACP5T4_02150 [Candidatus Micrarchaeia archaeon]
MGIFAKQQQTEPSLKEIAKEFDKALRQVPYRFSLKKEEETAEGAEEQTFCFYASGADKAMLTRILSKSKPYMLISKEPTIKITREGKKVIFEPVYSKLLLFPQSPNSNDFIEKLLATRMTPSIRSEDFKNAFGRMLEKLKERYAKLPEIEVKPVMEAYRIDVADIIILTQ